MFRLGKVHYEIGDRINAMSFGGIGAVRRLVSKLGLPTEIDRRLRSAEEAPALLMNRTLSSTSPTTCCGEGVRLEDLGGLRQRGLHGRPGGEADPEPDGGGRFHAALRRGGRRSG